MKQLKKLLCLFLALCVLAGTAPLSVLASDEQQDPLAHVVLGEDLTVRSDGMVVYAEFQPPEEGDYAFWLTGKGGMLWSVSDGGEAGDSWTVLHLGANDSVSFELWGFDEGAVLHSAPYTGPIIVSDEPTDLTPFTVSLSYGLVADETFAAQYPDATLYLLRSSDPDFSGYSWWMNQERCRLGSCCWTDLTPGSAVYYRLVLAGTCCDPETDVLLSSETMSFVMPPMPELRELGDGGTVTLTAEAGQDFLFRLPALSGDFVLSASSDRDTVLSDPLLADEAGNPYRYFSSLPLSGDGAETEFAPVSIYGEEEYLWFRVTEACTLTLRPSFSDFGALTAGENPGLSFGRTLCFVPPEDGVYTIVPNSEEYPVYIVSWKPWYSAGDGPEYYLIGGIPVYLQVDGWGETAPALTITRVGDLPEIGENAPAECSGSIILCRFTAPADGRWSFSGDCGGETAYLYALDADGSELLSATFPVLDLSEGETVYLLVSCYDRVDCSFSVRNARIGMQADTDYPIPTVGEAPQYRFTAETDGEYAFRMTGNGSFDYEYNGTRGADVCLCLTLAAGDTVLLEPRAFSEGVTLRAALLTGPILELSPISRVSPVSVMLNYALLLPSSLTDQYPNAVLKIVQYRDAQLTQFRSSLSPSVVGSGGVFSITLSDQEPGSSSWFRLEVYANPDAAEPLTASEAQRADLPEMPPLRTLPDGPDFTLELAPGEDAAFALPRGGICGVSGRSAEDGAGLVSFLLLPDGSAKPAYNERLYRDWDSGLISPGPVIGDGGSLYFLAESGGPYTITVSLRAFPELTPETALTGEDAQLCRFVFPESGVYTLQTEDIGWLYTLDSDGLWLGSDTELTGLAGQLLYISASVLSSDSRLSVVKTGEFPALSEGQTLTVGSDPDRKYFLFTPDTDGTYRFSLTGRAYDGLTVLDENGETAAEIPFGWLDSAEPVEVQLRAGKTCALRLRYGDRGPLSLSVGKVVPLDFDASDIAKLIPNAALMKDGSLWVFGFNAVSYAPVQLLPGVRFRDVSESCMDRLLTAVDEAGRVLINGEVLDLPEDASRFAAASNRLGTAAISPETLWLSADGETKVFSAPEGERFKALDIGYEGVWLLCESGRVWLLWLAGGLTGVLTRVPTADILYDKIAVTPSSHVRLGLTADGDLHILHSSVSQISGDDGDAVTRGLLANYLTAVLNPDPIQGENPFRDLNVGDDCYIAALTAVSLGLMNGMSDGCFHPESPVTQSQYVRLAVACAEKLGDTLPDCSDDELPDFLVGHRAKTYYAKAIRAGLLTAEEAAPDDLLTVGFLNSHSERFLAAAGRLLSGVRSVSIPVFNGYYFFALNEEGRVDQVTPGKLSRSPVSVPPALAYTDTVRIGADGSLICDDDFFHSCVRRYGVAPVLYDAETKTWEKGPSSGSFFFSIKGVPIRTWPSAVNAELETEYHVSWDEVEGAAAYFHGSVLAGREALVRVVPNTGSPRIVALDAEGYEIAYGGTGGLNPLLNLPLFEALQPVVLTAEPQAPTEFNPVDQDAIGLHSYEFAAVFTAPCDGDYRFSCTGGARFNLYNGEGRYLFDLENTLTLRGGDVIYLYGYRISDPVLCSVTALLTLEAGEPETKAVSAAVLSGLTQAQREAVLLVKPGSPDLLRSASDSVKARAEALKQTSGAERVTAEVFLKSEILGADFGGNGAESITVDIRPFCRITDADSGAVLTEAPLGNASLAGPTTVGLVLPFSPGANPVIRHVKGDGSVELITESSFDPETMTLSFLTDGFSRFEIIANDAVNVFSREAEGRLCVAVRLNSDTGGVTTFGAAAYDAEGRMLSLDYKNLPLDLGENAAEFELEGCGDAASVRVFTLEAGELVPLGAAILPEEVG